MNDRKFEQAMELVGVLLFVSCMGFAFLVAVLVGAVGGHAGGSTGGVASPSTVQTESSSPSARSLGSGSAGGETFPLSDGCRPIACSGGGDRDGVSGAMPPAPASTTISSPVVGASGESLTPATSTYAPLGPTVIISAQPPPATAVTSPRAVETTWPVSNTLEAQVRASVERYFSASLWSKAMSVATCETHGTFNVLAVGAAGEIGIWQINPAIWGAVPGDIDGQTALAASIVARYGFAPWSCK